jgi:TetR/AcrR family transcriptional regulator, mexJK operon transcriptional repressor
VQTETKAEIRDDPKEEKILAAAAEAFLEFGYAGTSMDIVAQRARASKTTLYTRFASKEELFAATISAYCIHHGMELQLDEMLRQPPEKVLCRIGRNFVDLILSPQAVRMEQIITGEAPRFPEVARIFHEAGPQRTINVVARYLAEAAARGQLSVADPQFTARQFLMSLKAPNCEQMLALPLMPPEERDAFVAKVVRLFLDGTAPRR